MVLYTRTFLCAARFELSMAESSCVLTAGPDSDEKNFKEDDVWISALNSMSFR